MNINISNMNCICDKKFQKELFRVMTEELNLDEKTAAEKILQRYKREVRVAVVNRLETVISRVKSGCTDMNLVSKRQIKFKDCCGLKDLVSVYEVQGMWVDKFLKELKDNN